ncbi:MAG: D-alanine--D-alanine ligase [Candidatus Marinimicrobia bacterium]|nr:D-alanine--D-alanine ligase [Candidatus Neomarinimicrobiota bacterium]
MNLCILLGGASSERNVSLATGMAVGKALESLGHSVIYVDPSTPWDTMDSFRESLETSNVADDHFENMVTRDESVFIEHIRELKTRKIDVIFNALHGGSGENGIIPAVLEMADIPYTGSGPLASALAMDKFLSKTLAKTVGVKSADVIQISDPEKIDQKSLQFPLVIKPNNAGSSVGLHVLMEPCDLKPFLKDALKYDTTLLIEEYIPGQELTVPIVGGIPFPLIEIVPEGGVYTFETKYISGKSHYLVPAPLSHVLTNQLKEQALAVWNILGLESYARIDFRVKDEKDIYFLEANTLPGMTATSLLPKSAKVHGMSFPELIAWIVNDALTRFHKKKLR